MTYPDDNGPRLVRSADLVVGTLGDMVEEELEKILGFFILETNNAAGEALVNVESLLSGDRVYAHDGVL